MLTDTDIANIRPGAYISRTFDEGGPGSFFGRPMKVVEVHARREDLNGVPFVCFWTETSATSRTSGSAKAGRDVVRLVPAEKVEALNAIAKGLAAVRFSTPYLYKTTREHYIAEWDRIWKG